MECWKDIREKVISAWSGSQVEDWNSFRVVRVDVVIRRALSDLFDWHQDAPSVYFFDPLTRMEHAGFGAALLQTGSGPDAFGDTGQRIKQTTLPRGLRWFGGVAFDPTVQPAGIWENWPHALWFVPNLTLLRPAGSDVVHVTFVAPKSHAQTDVREMLDLFGRHKITDVSVGAHGLSLEKIHTPEQWEKMIQQALTDIESNQLHKVVLARQAHTKVHHALPEALHKLLSEYPDSHIFALQWADVWLLGASPERLVRSDDGVLQVDCLAGSIARGEDEQTDHELASELMNSRKNRQEHAAVVHYVADRMKLVAVDIEYGETPRMKRLANVQHLYTPVRGRLRSGQHLFDAAKLLHPTPAVGGVPQFEALSFIRREEQWPRGYYAGAVGFVDGEGNGLLSVALRTAAVRYPDGLLFAGCGIVDGSDALDEWRETEMKLQPMRMALE